MFDKLTANSVLRTPVEAVHAAEKLLLVARGVGGGVLMLLRGEEQNLSPQKSLLSTLDTISSMHDSKLLSPNRSFGGLGNTLDYFKPPDTITERIKSVRIFHFKKQYEPNEAGHQIMYTISIELMSDSDAKTSKILEYVVYEPEQGAGLVELFSKERLSDKKVHSALPKHTPNTRQSIDKYRAFAQDRQRQRGESGDEARLTDADVVALDNYLKLLVTKRPSAIQKFLACTLGW